jgi:hypothetical protein
MAIRKGRLGVDNVAAGVWGTANLVRPSHGVVGVGLAGWYIAAQDRRDEVVAPVGMLRRAGNATQ